jgi:hypothetical protein
MFETDFGYNPAFGDTNPDTKPVLPVQLSQAFILLRTALDCYPTL